MAKLYDEKTSQNRSNNATVSGGRELNHPENVSDKTKVLPLSFHASYIAWSTPAAIEVHLRARTCSEGGPVT